MPGESGEPTVTTLVWIYFFSTRGCGCIEHPAFPTPSDVQMASHDAKLARITRRDRGGVGVCTSPRLRGEVEAGRLRVRGTLGAPECVEIPPHPDPLPASGAREKRNGRCVGWPLPSGRDEEGVIAKSERDEAIHSCLAAMDCFACARNDGFNGLRLAVGTRVSHFWVNCGRRDAYTATGSPVLSLPLCGEGGIRKTDRRARSEAISGPLEKH